MQARPKVGVGVLLLRQGATAAQEVLVGRRKGSHGSGTYALPGGHLEMGESFEECAVRELEEETGIRITSPPAFAYAVNSVFDAASHYVTVFMQASVPADTEAKLTEPDKCEGWIWAPWDALGAGELQPLFLPLQILKESPFRPSE